MNAWFLLFISICTEVCGTTLLKISDGFTKPIPTVLSLFFFGVALYFIAISFRTLPVGLVYAVWSGAGIILMALIGFFVFGQKPDVAGYIGMAMILGGVLIINLLSETKTH